MSLRVSTSLVFGAGADRISRQQAELARTQNQLASGQRVATPSDDPVAAAAALRVAQAKAQSAQYQSNQGTARDALAFGESQLGDANGTLIEARTLLVDAGNGALSDSDRASLAISLDNATDRLLGTANARDANGNYVFAGFQSGSMPFLATPAGAQYVGDEGARDLEVAGGRRLAVSASGAEIFDRVPTGNGSFSIAPAASNAGTATHDGGSVANPAALTGHAYRVSFSVSGGATTYDVQDLTLGAAVATAQPYTSGTAIQFGGEQVTFQGAPANGDRFDVQPSTSQSVFTTLRSLSAMLRQPATTAANRAALANALTTGLQQVDQANERVLAVRARMGAGLNELDQLGAQVSADALQEDTQLARLTGLDYAQAAGQFAAQQAALQAAQQSYVRVAGLSMFQYL